MIQITSLKLNWLAELTAALLILLFMYTAINKLIDIDNFNNTLMGSPYLRSNAAVLSLAIPITEILISILLFIPGSRSVGLLYSSVLMCIFSLYVGFMILFSNGSLPCSCGGIIQQMSWNQHLIFNILFTLLSLVAWRIKKPQLKFLLQ